MKVFINVRLKDAVLDPQGAAVKDILTRAGYDFVKDVRQNKLFEIELNGETAPVQLSEIADKFLANPIIEEFKISR
ncbi:MAG: phosphoribosylformylglycinamidine synthase subunit PurS [Deferribacteraceae bacterium]|jgi:phosphoribosylformylglycinamidine synthase|nr:phosphoribosylformylglycinamidine synthase subunit PurS [Deferribacteraceae bacterium]